MFTTPNYICLQNIEIIDFNAKISLKLNNAGRKHKCLADVKCILIPIFQLHKCKAEIMANKIVH